MSSPRNGQDGWSLVDYEWDVNTGESLTIYERSVYGMSEERTVQRTQRTYWLPAHLRSDAN